MSRTQKLFDKAKQAPANYRFSDLCTLLERVGYVRLRIRGSHHFFRHNATRDVINIQSAPRGKAKPTQVRDVVEKIERFRLMEAADDRQD